jgi:hypothetical protein
VAVASVTDLTRGPESDDRGHSVTANDDFFRGRKPAAVLKHALLAEYLTVFTSMLGSRYRGRPLWLLDSYAGPGMYAADGDGKR